MNGFIDIIGNNILQRMPEMKRGVWLAFLDKNGRVLSKQPGQNEFEFAGIEDLDDAYFYIRFRDEGQVSHSETPNAKKFASMQQFFRARYELRAVAVLRNAEPQCLEEKLRVAILTANLPQTASHANPNIEPVTSYLNSMHVLRKETPGEKERPFDVNMSFVALDFDLVVDIDVNLPVFCEAPCNTGGVTC